MAALLSIENLSVTYQTQHGIVSAVENLSLTLNEGSITCIIGESGSGKTSVAHALLRILPSYAEVTGRVYFQETELLQCARKDLTQLKGLSIFYISQNPAQSFHPSIKIGKQTYEMFGRRLGLSKKEFSKRFVAYLKKLHFLAPEKVLVQYPIQLSGGMLQRVNLACAFIVEPKLIIADEPTAALDTDVQKLLLQFIIDSKKSLDISYLVVTHDLGVVAEIADRVIVMKEGKVIEENDVFSFFNDPKEAYTKQLLETSF